MLPSAGQKRVVISEIVPFIDGHHPAKVLQGEPFKIKANVFCDGHDTVAASVLYRHPGERWRELELVPAGNDCWETDLTIRDLGYYEFKVHGWIDHFKSWRKGFLKKRTVALSFYVPGGPDTVHADELDTDLKIGLAIVAEALAHLRAGKITEAVESPYGLHLAEIASLENWAGQLRGKSVSEEALPLIENIAGLMSRYRNRLFSETLAAPLQVQRKKAGFSAWYELFPRSASRQSDRPGTFLDVIQLLPRIAQLGFDVLYFPPIHPVGELKRKGRNNSLDASPEDPGSPWAIGSKLGGHKSIDPKLGDFESFHRLMEAASGYGIELALDMAFQCAPDHPYVKEHPTWFLWRPDGTVQYAENPPKKYEDILPFNFETDDWKSLWDELKGVLEFWVAKGVRIFRVDNPHTKSFYFWRWAIAEIKRHTPDVIFLAEAFTRPRLMEELAKNGFDQSYTYFAWRTTKKELETYLKELQTYPVSYYFRPNFWPNTPDILTHQLATGGEAAHIQRFLLASTLSGNYGIYGPVYEFLVAVPAEGKEEYSDNEKYEVKHWDWDQWTKTGEVIRRVNALRKTAKAFGQSSELTFLETDNDQIICYLKSSPEKRSNFLIVVNLDSFKPQTAYVKFPGYLFGFHENTNYKLYDHLSGSSYTWKGEWNFVSLDPQAMPGHILELHNPTER